jgi:N-acylneuraminate cytidylyltransferase
MTTRRWLKMLDEKKILAIIPARAGSKRVPLKNLTLYKVGNETDTLLGWAVKHAKASKYIDHTVISSDLPAQCHEGTYSEPEWLPRPAFLCGDRTPTEAVLTNVLYLCGGYDYAVLLQPTSPLRTAQDIDRCIEIAVKQNGVNGLTGCVSYNPSGKRNGAVYVVNVNHFLEFLSLDAAHHYEMPAERSLDIDYIWDFQAEAS